MSIELMRKILEISFYGSAMALILIGVYGVLTRRNLIKIMLSFSVVDSGVNLLFISVGYILNGTAPIFSPAVVGKDVTMVDPVPQALVLTAIVIGLGVTAVGLALVLRLYRHHNSINIDEIRNLKW